MTVAQFDPVKELLALKDRMNKIIENAMSRTQYGGSADMVAWSPAVDIYETSDRFVVVAELPGLSPEEIEIKVSGNTLTLRGERSLEKEIQQENYHRIERAYGSFSRSFPLPAGVQASETKAKYSLGVLHVVMTKTRNAAPEQVKIQVT